MTPNERVEKILEWIAGPHNLKEYKAHLVAEIGAAVGEEMRVYRQSMELYWRAVVKRARSEAYEDMISFIHETITDKNIKPQEILSKVQGKFEHPLVQEKK
jgi:hypothetical protein